MRYATEHALYTRRWGKEELIIDMYVDDLIVTGTRVEDIDSFKRDMAAHFRMSGLGAFSYYLGIEGTVDQGIVFPKTGGSRLQLTLFSDTDMAGDIDGWQSTPGVLVFLGLAPISWLSLK
ncbi:uncharacterized protein [Miscanthus floridulus]|uniref:uncharacterized protein n=1 Tax=Miscanthus floridulus TaxID=154761 RepID=UPI003459741E